MVWLLRYISLRFGGFLPLPVCTLYDLNNMVFFGLFDEQEKQQLRKCAVLYLAIAGDTGVCGFETERTIKRDLLPMIRGADHFDFAKAKERVSNFLHETMKLTDQESQFLSRFYMGHYEPQLLFDDSETIARIEHHPMAMWRMARILLLQYFCVYAYMNDSRRNSFTQPIIKHRWEIIMIEFQYDVQLLIEGENLSEDEAVSYVTKHLKGDCLLIVGDETLLKVHFHTNEPWQILAYCASLGDIYDIVVENMLRQANGMHG
jgi:hypothetical protein